MMRGKYSPTVVVAYARNQKWHMNYMSLGCCIYDPEGYDSYGYNSSGFDRAGNHQNNYIDTDEYGTNWWYDQTLDEWDFDGVKPVKRTDM